MLLRNSSADERLCVPPGGLAGPGADASSRSNCACNEAIHPSFPCLRVLAQRYRTMHGRKGLESKPVAAEPSPHLSMKQLLAGRHCCVLHVRTVNNAPKSRLIARGMAMGSTTGRDSVHLILLSICQECMRITIYDLRTVPAPFFCLASHSASVRLFASSSSKSRLLPRRRPRPICPVCNTTPVGEKFNYIIQLPKPFATIFVSLLLPSHDTSRI